MITLHDVPVIAGLAATTAALGWAAVSDVRHYLIPNRIPLIIAAAFGVAAIGTPPGSWLSGLATGLAVLAVGVLLFWRGWAGGGDVKLAAVVALWAGPAHISDFALVTSVAGAALAGLMLTPLRRLMPQPADGPAEGLRQPMPFGVPLAAGGLWVVVLQFATLA